MKAKIRYFWEGKHRTIRELCEMSGLELYPQILECRLAAGKTLHEAMTTPLLRSPVDRGRRGALKANKSRSRRVLHNGEMHSAASLADLSMVGVSRQTVNERLRRGWTAERAISTPVR